MGRNARLYHHKMYAIIGPILCGIGAFFCGASYFMYKYKQTGVFRRPELVHSRSSLSQARQQQQQQQQQRPLNMSSSLPCIHTATGFHHLPVLPIDYAEPCASAQPHMKTRGRAFSASCELSEYNDRAIEDAMCLFIGYNGPSHARRSQQSSHRPTQPPRSPSTMRRASSRTLLL
ncbi:PREDICTED: uncharacterized protein LOC106809538 [Priapulus caudatus]|uniref:Uncharacterized protein LOC106809538 n=1 Tax=Priapulus caudatus TaxID=37621 RepID=A0ABM1E7F0_PRICU|nr:PREDICTED: uncharacterized protein LOC106809538 [Priapulus caudatus]